MAEPPPPPMICIPLYLYPSPSAWDPLIHAAREHPSCQFLAIVNPKNGPGDAPLPDENYLIAGRQLATLANVQLLGYVHCRYGRRDACAIEGDIRKYRFWGKQDGKLLMDGIFFDEVPSASEQVGLISGLSEFARTMWGRGRPRSKQRDGSPQLANSGSEEAAEGSPGEGLVVLNPGVIVAKELYDVADFVVAFEQSHECWNRERENLLNAHTEGASRAKTVVMIHSCKAQDRALGELVSSVRLAGFGGQFVTEQESGGYSQWSPQWRRYVRHVSK